ncbi:hypothetical protein HDU84_008444 [Entophlyctis sp. JEL0112]|nr:hypothetical protein HDU84_008444 [Entophlyctis sp. JEL0112]
MRAASVKVSPRQNASPQALSASTHSVASKSTSWLNQVIGSFSPKQAKAKSLQASQHAVNAKDGDLGSPQDRDFHIAHTAAKLSAKIAGSSEHLISKPDLINKAKNNDNDGKLQSITKGLSPDISTSAIQPQKTTRNIQTSTSSLNKVMPQPKIHVSDHENPNSDKNNPITFANDKVNEIKNMIIEQEQKLDQYAKIVESADSHLQSKIESIQNTLGHATLQNHLTAQKNTLIAELRAERNMFSAAIAQAINDLKLAQRSHQQALQSEMREKDAAFRAAHEKQIAAVRMAANKAESAAEAASEIAKKTAVARAGGNYCAECVRLREHLQLKDSQLEAMQATVEDLELKGIDTGRADAHARLVEHIASLEKLASTQSQALAALTKTATDLHVHVQGARGRAEADAAARVEACARADAAETRAANAEARLAALDARATKAEAQVARDASPLREYQGAVRVMRLCVGSADVTRCTESPSGEPSLEDFVTSLVKDCCMLKERLRKLDLEVKDNCVEIQAQREKLFERDESLHLTEARLEAVVEKAQEWKEERDYAITKIKTMTKKLHEMEIRFQREIDVRDKAICELTDSSNTNLKSARQIFEVERQKFQEEIKQLMRENLHLESNLSQSTKDRRDLEAELAAVKKKLEHKTLDYLAFR